MTGSTIPPFSVKCLRQRIPAYGISRYPGAADPHKVLKAEAVVSKNRYHRFNFQG